MLLHVTNGDSTAITLRETSLGGDVLAWRDVLNEGPLLRDGFLDGRAAFLSACGWGDEETLLEEFEARDRQLATALADGADVILWFEHDLYDQLQLLQVITLLEGHSAQLINVATFLGAHTADELEALWPQRRPLSDDVRELARLGWETVCAPEPTAIESLLQGDTTALPFLGKALHRFLEELPDLENGLSRSERQMLELLEAEPRTPFDLFLASQSREEAAFDGDMWFFQRLADLQPLVTVEGKAELTDLGRQVLAGSADRVDVLGIDRWLGGTHLSPDNVWRWDRTTRKVVRA
jgi:hypothetical protein